jgi:Protein of unknown function (DUF3800)
MFILACFWSAILSNMYVFADEAGCFTFKDKQGSSKYFIICTVAAPTWHIAGDLLNLRRELAISGECERDKLHATTDAQAIRDKVSNFIEREFSN